MDEQMFSSTDYQQGFNEGYTICEHLPELGETIASAVPSSSRGEGFKDGRDQVFLDKTRERYPDWLKMDRFSIPGREPDIQKGREKDKEDLEPER